MAGSHTGKHLRGALRTFMDTGGRALAEVSNPGRTAATRAGAKKPAPRIGAHLFGSLPGATGSRHSGGLKIQQQRQRQPQPTSQQLSSFSHLNSFSQASEGSFDAAVASFRQSDASAVHTGLLKWFTPPGAAYTPATVRDWEVPPQYYYTPSAHTETDFAAAAEAGGAEDEGSVVQCATCGEVRFAGADEAVTLNDCGLAGCPFGGSKVALGREEAPMPSSQERILWRNIREARMRIRPQILGLAN